MVHALHNLRIIMVRSSLPGKFVFTSWEVIITTSGVFKLLWSEPDGGVPSLN